MRKRIMIFLLLPLAFAACQEKDLNLKIRYKQISGLKQGGRVIFEQSHIGKVNGVFRTEDGHCMVDVAIRGNFANAATEHSRFFIITDPQDTSKKAIEMTLIQKGGAPLEDGATVDGSTKSSAIFDQMRNDFEKGIKELKKQLEQFSKDLRSAPDSEEFKNLREELKRLSEEMKRSGEAAREKIEKEILPQIKKEIEKLREMLRKLRKKEETKPLKI